MKLEKINITQQYKYIPAKLNEKQFEEFVLPSLSVGDRGSAHLLLLKKVVIITVINLMVGMLSYPLPKMERC